VTRNKLLICYGTRAAELVWYLGLKCVKVFAVAIVKLVSKRLRSRGAFTGRQMYGWCVGVEIDALEVGTAPADLLHKVEIKEWISRGYGDWEKCVRYSCGRKLYCFSFLRNVLIESQYDGD
jgi:hypothetical protein